MRKSYLVVILGAALLAALTAFWPRSPGTNAAAPESQTNASADATAGTPPPTAADTTPSPGQQSHPATQPALSHAPPQPAQAPLSRTERLAQLRETFRELAAGDPKAALRAARGMTDDVEREIALLTLVTEWTHGQISNPRQRAWAIASYGLEAGLGMELAKYPELAQVWASELNTSQNRPIAPERLGPAMLDADPAAALAFAQQLSAEDRRKFLSAAFANLAGKDTEAALQWAEQLADPAERDAALKAIRGVVPVGIGVELGLQEGYPVINRMLPGTPADLSGQLQSGDRIIALAQGDNVFVDIRGLPMQEVVQAIRGSPGTLVQLQVLPADAPPDTKPRTVAIVRGQIKVKR